MTAKARLLLDDNGNFELSFFVVVSVGRSGASVPCIAAVVTGFIAVAVVVAGKCTDFDAGIIVVMVFGADVGN